MIPDWQLPPGVDRGLWDYLHASDMVAGYESQMAESVLAKADVAFCDAAFPTPGRLLDLGCGTGRLCRHFAAKGFECVGVDLSDEMLAAARDLTPQPPSLRGKGEQLAEGPGASVPGLSAGCLYLRANVVEALPLPDASFDYAACLFSTLGMVRGGDNRAKVLANAFRLLKPGGRFVLHVHNRRFRGLGWWRALFGSGDVTMPQAYGGAPLTLHHFTPQEIAGLYLDIGFRTREVRRLRVDGTPARWELGTYGYLWLAEKLNP